MRKWIKHSSFPDITLTENASVFDFIVICRKIQCASKTIHGKKPAIGIDFQIAANQSVVTGSGCLQGIQASKQGRHARH